MTFFRKDLKIRNKLELISIHIPKTAGTSFRNFLKHVYGEQNAVRLDINITTKKIDIENQAFEEKKLPGNIRVIHGHFYYRDLVEQIRIEEGTPMVTWLREPAERVISNYFYLAKRLKEELQEESKGLNILSKMQKSLIEYARNEISRNRMSKFLEGANLEKFFFTGIYEHYNEDMQDFAQLLGIKDFEIFQHNITGRKEEVDTGILEEIRSLNADDYELYNFALEIRKKRRKEAGAP
ncbi:MAG: sulfotransferase family protein [Bacteroidetes bacterium]|nr:sulfotransferase family protein [Bacteroidota bacterium]